MGQTSAHPAPPNRLPLRERVFRTTAAPPYASTYASICMWLGLLSFLVACVRLGMAGACRDPGLCSHSINSKPPSSDYVREI
jgi:hypothetical protein